MAAIVDFVDAVSATPTTRLDLNDGATWSVVMSGTDFTPPALRRAVTSTMLAHGDWVAATAYTNRRVTLLLQLRATDTDGVATALSDLMRELDRTYNLLRVQRDGATKPVFFETFRSPTATLIEQLKTTRQARVEIECKPFAVGLKETLTPVSVSNDPATGCYIDVPFPAGDVETPLYLNFDATDVIATGRRQTSLACRRRGTPSAAPWIIQAESMTLASNTTLQANDSAMSGAGQNYVRASSLTSSYVTRLTSAVFPSSSSVDARGKYRPYVRVRKTNGSGEVRVRLAVSPDGTTDYIADTVGVVLPTGTGIRWAELPVVQIPIGEDPITDGPSQNYLASRGVIFKLQVCLTANSSNLDIDCIVLMPADDRFCRVLWPEISGPTTMVLDSSNKPKVYGLGASGETYSTAIRGLDGGGTPLVSPNSYNRVWMLLDTGSTSNGDSIANTTVVTPYYWPRYLSPMRPALP